MDVRTWIPELTAAMWQWVLLAFLLAVTVVWRRWPDWGPTRRWTALLLLATLGVLCMAAWPGTLGAQKMLTSLVMPAGLIWFAVVGLCIAAWAGWQRIVKAGLMALLVLLTLVGNGSVSKGLYQWMERDYAPIDPFNQPPYDALIVLGGMTSEGPGQRMQLSGAGDRLLLAARLYLSGQTSHVVTTGVQIEGYSFDSVEPGQRSAGLLEALGVPRQQITIVRGHNTKEELKELDRLRRDRDWKRVGLITSAWHMPRAMRLARRAGVDVHPVPADFLGRRPWLTRTILVPDADALVKMERLAKEALAWAVGR